MLYGHMGEVPEEEYLVPIGKARVRREGTDVTLVTYNKMVLVAEEAAKKLEAEGISAEVIDLRTIRPMDHATIINSVKKTNRIVVIDESWPFAGVSAEVAYIAHVFAMNGYTVQLVDISEASLKKALATIEKNLGRMVQKEKITAADQTDTLARISTNTDLKAACAEADLVVEAATENVDLKLKIFKQIDEAAPEKAILATNTSSISITKIAAITNRPEKVIGMHFMNPVPIMKLVEVIRGYATTDEVNNTIVAVSKKLGKVPTEANDYPGFVANRILIPMINEAIYTLHEGVAGVQEIDTVMKLGMAHPMGPLQLADFIGLDTVLAI